MSDELQDDITIEQPDEGSELATETEITEQTPVETEEQRQAKTQAAFNTQYGKTKHQERRADALEKELNTLKSSQNQVQAIDVPDFPDEFDDDHDSKLENWKSAVQQQANFNAQRNAAQQSKQAEIEAAQAKANIEYQSNYESYAAKATELGVSQEERVASEQTFMNFQVNGDVEQAIMNDPDGALIIKHLVSNPVDLQNLAGMNPIAAWNHIMTDVKPKASALKPKTSSAPNPSTNISGVGVNLDTGKFPNSEGATFS